MKYLKRDGKLVPILTRLMDSKSIKKFEGLDKNNVITLRARNVKYAVVDDVNPTVSRINPNHIIEIRDDYSVNVLGHIAGMVSDSASIPLLEESIVAPALVAYDQSLEQRIQDIPFIGEIPATVPLDISYLTNPINATIPFVKQFIQYCRSVYASIYRMTLFLDAKPAFDVLEATIADRYDHCSVVKFTCEGTTYFALLGGHYNQLPELEKCVSGPDYRTINISTETIQMNLNKLKDDYKANPDKGTFCKVLDTVSELYQLKDLKTLISDSEYDLIQSGSNMDVAATFEEGEEDKIQKYLEDNPGTKVVKNEGKIYVVSEDVDSDNIEEVTDAVEGLEGYTLEKVGKDIYSVDVNGNPAYTIQKKGTKWNCDCKGFQHRGKCKHLGLLEDVLPKRHPRQEIDNLIPNIKNLLDTFGKWEVVGSYRRGVKDFKDIDILVECDPSSFPNILKELEKDQNYVHTMAGNHIIRGKYLGYDFDLTRVDKGEWGSYLLYRTGSAQFNIRMRGLVKSKNWRLNEHGLFDDQGNKIAGETEESIFEALNLKFVQPEDRN